MKDNQPQSVDNDDSFESFTRPGASREEGLERRWRKVISHKIIRQAFELLSRQPDRPMYIAEVARALGKVNTYVYSEIHHLKRVNIAEVEWRSGHAYYRLRPGMVDQFQQWLESQKPNEPQP